LTESAHQVRSTYDAVAYNFLIAAREPAELPVQAPTKFELVINMKAGKALGLNLPLQQRDDKMINKGCDARYWPLADIF